MALGAEVRSLKRNRLKKVILSNFPIFPIAISNAWYLMGKMLKVDAYKNYLPWIPYIGLNFELQKWDSWCCVITVFSHNWPGIFSPNMEIIKDELFPFWPPWPGDDFFFPLNLLLKIFNVSFSITQAQRVGQRNYFLFIEKQQQ